MDFLELLPPALIIGVSFPLILKRIPRNGLYGFRTPRTCASDEVWYPANRFAGVAMGIAGVVWLIATFAVPPPQSTFLGVAVLVGSVVASFLYLRTL